MKKGLRFQAGRIVAMAAIAISMGLNASAQSYPYTVDFEAPDGGTAPSKSYASTDPVELNGINWTLPGVFLGSMLANDKYNGERAARMRLSDNASGDPGYMQMEGDLSNGIGTVTLNAAMYGTETDGSLGVYYSTDGGTTWTQSGSNITLTDVLTAYTFDINQSGSVRVKILKAETSNARINVDDISMTQFGTATTLSLESKAPTGTDVPLSVNELSLTFAEDIAAGSGSVTLTEEGGSTTTLDVSDAAISGATATFSGITLENAATYDVSVPAGAFTNTDASLSSAEITWTFSTVDTAAPPINTYTSLDETFTNCDNDGLMGVFTQYSVAGTKTWHCSQYGYGDSNAVYINGGSAAGVSEANFDWLISAGTFDLAAMDHPVLSLWQKRRFDGDVERKVLVATDYVPGTDPTATNVIWENVYTFDAGPDTAWSEVTDIDLTAYKDAPFYLAFTYSCGETGAYELTYDDIKITDDNGSGIFNISKGNIGIKVLGNATRNNMLLQVNVARAMNARIEIYDMQGRRVYNGKQQLYAGANRFGLNNYYINSGMYIVRIGDGHTYGTVKAMVD